MNMYGNKNEIVNKLNELLETEVNEFQKYSETPTGATAKQGMEEEYNYHKKKVGLVSNLKNIIFFSFIFQSQK